VGRFGSRVWVSVSFQIFTLTAGGCPRSGELSGGDMSGGICPMGECPGEKCHTLLTVHGTKEVDLYSAFIVVGLPHTQDAQVRITQFYLQITSYLPLPRKRSPDGASPD